MRVHESQMENVDPRDTNYSNFSSPEESNTTYENQMGPSHPSMEYYDQYTWGRFISGRVFYPMGTIAEESAPLRAEAAEFFPATNSSDGKGFASPHTSAGDFEDTSASSVVSDTSLCPEAPEFVPSRYMYTGAKPVSHLPFSPCEFSHVPVC